MSFFDREVIYVCRKAVKTSFLELVDAPVDSTKSCGDCRNRPTSSNTLNCVLECRILALAPSTQRAEATIDPG